MSAKGENGLHYEATLGIDDLKKKADEAIKVFQKLKQESSSALNNSGSFDTKPLTAYQAEMIKIKQQKLEQDRIDRQTSLATQAALREEARIKREQLALEKVLKPEQTKKKPKVSNSQAEIDAYNNMTNGSKAVTSALNEQDKAQAKVASSAAAVVSTTNQATSANKSNNLSKKESAKLLAEEKYIQAQATKELKNNIREQLNAKGSLEQRRAALIRLNTAYDRLSVSERNSTSGQRLQGIIGRINEQVLSLEKNTGRAQCNVGNYLNKAWGGLKMIANILPGLGLAGLLGFAIEPILKYIAQLDIFGKKVSEIIKTRQQLSDANLEGAKNAQAEITTLSLLYKQYTDSNIPLEQRKEAYRELQRMYPDYFRNIKFEQDQADKSKIAYDNLTTSIIATAKARAAMDKITENATRQLENDQKISDAETEINKQKATEQSSLNKLRTEDAANARFNAREAQNAEKERAKQLKVIADARTDSNILAERNLALEKNINKEIAKGGKLSGSTGGTPPKVTGLPRIDSELKARNTLQAQIDALTKKGVDKQLSANEQEVEAIRNKYAALRNQAIAYNQEQAKLDADRIKKGLKARGLRADSGSLAEAEKQEVFTITYKQDTEVLKANLDRQKELYSEYEDYKTELGKQAADARYSNELDTTVSFLQKLEAERAKLLDKDPTEMSGVELDRLNEYDRRIANEVASEQKKYDALLKDFATYQNQKRALIENYNRDYAALENNPEAQAIRTRKYQDDLDALNDNALKKTEIYKRAAAEAVVITKQQTQQQIEALSKILEIGVIPENQASIIQTQIDRLRFTLKIGVDNGNIASLKDEFTRVAQQLNATDDSGERLILSEENYKAVIQRLAQIQSDIDEIDGNGDGKSTWGDKIRNQFEYLDGDASEIATGLSRDLGQLSSSFGELSNALGGNNTEAGYFLDTLSSITKAGQDAAGAFASFATGDIIGGIAKTISAVTSVLSIGKKVREMNEAARKEVEDFYQNAITGEREYQDLLKERELQTIRNNKLVLQGIRDEISLRRSQSADYNKEAAEIMSKLQGQRYVSDEKYIHGTWFRKAKVEKTYSSLQGKSFEQLSQLLAQGKLEGDAKALVERLKELEEKGYDAEQAIADLAKETSELFTGTTSSNLTDSLLEMFKSGKTGAQDLADFFKQSMDEAALSIFKNKVLADAMEDFYKKFDVAAQSGDELTAAEIAGLQIDFSNMTTDALKKFEEFKKITGSDLSGGTNGIDTGGSSLRGGITPITSSSLEIRVNKNLSSLIKQ